jgi:hypothetical protein
MLDSAASCHSAPPARGHDETFAIEGTKRAAILDTENKDAAADRSGGPSAPRSSGMTVASVIRLFICRLTNLPSPKRAFAETIVRLAAAQRAKRSFAEEII